MGSQLSYQGMGIVSSIFASFQKAISSFATVLQVVEVFTRAPAMEHLPTWLHLRGKGYEEAQVPNK